MKKTFPIVLALTLLIIFSCRKNFMPGSDELNGTDKFDVAQARDHIRALVKGTVAYDGKQAPALLATNSTTPNVKPKTIKTGQKIFYPFWDRATTANFKGKVDYVEVPIALSNKRIHLYQFKKDNIKLKPDGSVVLASFQRLIIYKDRKGKVGQRLVTYIPDKQYIKDHGYEVGANTLAKINRDFFGYIEYKNWSGSIISVLRIENGKVVRRYKLKAATKDQQPATEVQGTASGSDKITNTTITTCEYECTPIFDTVCETHDDGNPNDENLNEVECTYQQVGEDCNVVCTTEEIPDPDPCPWGNCDDEDPCDDCGEDPESPPIDCAGVMFGSAYIADCGCIGGTTGIADCDDPCGQKNILKDQADASQNNTANSSLLNNLNSTNSTINGKEYGSEKNLQGTCLTCGYMTPNVRTDASSNSFTPTFTWDATNGYTIGATHSHPGHSSPSPADVMWIVNRSNEPALTNAGATDVQFFKDNASVTVVTTEGNYVITIADWATIGTLGSTASLTATYTTEAQNYYANNPNATAGDATAYGLMKAFGNSINLYKAPLNSNTYTPLKIDTTTNKVATKPC